MTKGHILVVEDEFDIANMLDIYFRGQGFTVDVAHKGQDALNATRKQLPNLIILDINLPDMSGYEVCRDLRVTTRTSHIPIIFLTQKDERSDKIAGLELGADDYITKPFDIEELKLRVQNAILAAGRQKNVHPITNLPTGGPIEEHLRSLMRDTRHWTYIDVKIMEFETFSEVYGWSAGDEVLRFMALLIGDAIDKYGTPDDYSGHPGRDNFVAITHSNEVDDLIDMMATRFLDDIQQHYSFIDRERGYMLVQSGGEELRVPLMSLAIGHVSTRTHHFSDIREITEVAAENRRRGDSSENSNSDDILTAW